MKKLLLGVLLLTGLSAQAMTINDRNTFNLNRCDNDTATFFFCGVSTTTSLPTVLVADKEIQLGTEEANLMILAESVSESDADPVSEALAAHLGKDVAEVQAAAIQYYSNK